MSTEAVCWLPIDALATLEELNEALRQRELAGSSTERLEASKSQASRGDLTIAMPDIFDDVASAPLAAASDHPGFINCYRSRHYSPDELLSIIGTHVALGLKAARRSDFAWDRDPVRELLGLLADGKAEVATRRDEPRGGACATLHTGPDERVVSSILSSPRLRGARLMIRLS